MEGVTGVELGVEDGTSVNGESVGMVDEKLVGVRERLEIDEAVILGPKTVIFIAGVDMTIVVVSTVLTGVREAERTKARDKLLRNIAPFILCLVLVNIECDICSAREFPREVPRDHYRDFPVTSLDQQEGCDPLLHIVDATPLSIKKAKRLT